MARVNAYERILELAARQHGVVTRAQLLGAGVSAGAVKHRLRKGTLRLVHRGVYRTGPVAARDQREMAAVLACGPAAVLSHGTAAGVWGMMAPPQRETPVHVAGPRSVRGPASGVRLHRLDLHPDEVSRKLGLPLTRSEAEARFLALLRAAGVPRPRTNAAVNGLEVDFLWPDRRVVVEIDGFAYHRRRSAFENDRRRDALLAADGFTVARFTWRQMMNEPEKTLVRLAMTLGAHGGRKGGGGVGSDGPGEGS